LSKDWKLNMLWHW